MNFSNWQLILALVCVAAAVILLIRRAVRLWTGRSGCESGGCQDCPSHDADSQGIVRKELVSLDPSSMSRDVPHEELAADSEDAETAV